MSENKNFWINILINDLLILIFLVIGSSFFNYILKNQISETFKNEVRNDFLLSNHREINRKAINFLDYTDFSELNTGEAVFKNSKKSVFLTDVLELSSKQVIYSSSSDEKKVIGTLIFKYSIVPAFGYALLVWGLLNFFLILFIPRIKKYLELKILKQQEVLRSKKEGELALQVSHDIRSPVAALNSIAENIKDNSEDYRLLQRTILRINEIANRLLIDNESKFVEIPDFYLINSFIKEIIEEKEIQYRKRTLEISFQESSDQFAYIAPVEFKRIISNILNNSIEANDLNPKIHIKISEEVDVLELLISDNGKGIPQIVVENLGQEAITTKVHGNGLGLNHAYSKIKEWGGEFKILETNSKGTKIKICLKSNGKNIRNIKTILIDDDALTRTVWESRAKNAGISFQCFHSVDSFKEALSSLDKASIIYIDSELGEIKGEDLARELHERGFLNLSITSGHPADKFVAYPFLRSIITKKAPF